MRRVLAFFCAVGLLLAWTRAPLLFAGARPRLHLGQSSRSRPTLSPHETTEGSVDGADLSIVYGRPSMRGRIIFGRLVPFDNVWCPGADECTRLTTNHDLRFGAFTLKAGAYTMWMLPTATTWSLIFNSDQYAFHTRHSTDLDVGTVELQKQTLSSPVEQLTFAIEKDPRGSGGFIAMSWEKTRVSAPFTVVR